MSEYLHIELKVKFEITFPRCTIDLSQLEKEKTHELWQQLECGQGSLHLLITLNSIPRNMQIDNVPTTNGVRHTLPAEEKYVSTYMFK